MKKINLIQPILIIKIFFIFIFLNYVYFSFRLTLRQNSWITGDWLINYADGIIRRGLSGEILIFLSNIFSLNVLYIVIFIQSILFLLFLIHFLQIIKNKEITIWYFFLIFSPLTFLFTFYDPLTVGRKEVIFFLVYTLYIKYFLVLKNNILTNFSFLFAGTILVLLHEIFIFFLFFFLFPKFLSLKLNNKNFNIKIFKNELFLILGSIIGIFFLLVFSIGNSDINNLTCQRLVDKGLNENICDGTIAALNSFGFSNYIFFNDQFRIFKYISDYNYIKTYPIYILLFFIPLFQFLKKNNIKKNIYNYFILFFFIQLIILLPIFIVVNDWGRYLNIFFIFNLIFLSYFVLKKKDEITFKKPIKNYLFLMPLLILYATSWHMPHCCQKNFGKGLISFKDRIYFRLHNPTNFNDKTREFILKLINR